MTQQAADKFIADLEHEVENLKRRRDLEIETAANILSDSWPQRHRGHNLGNAANEISELSAKIEQTEMILTSFRNFVAFDGKEVK